MATTRRAFLVTATLTGAALLVRCRRDGEDDDESDELRRSPWLEVRRDGAIELVTPKLEMGQGIVTAMTLLVAEELDVDAASIRTRAPSTPELPKGRRTIETSSSRSVADCWPILRRAAARSRTLFVGAAAARWGIAETDCATDGEGGVVHRASGRRLGYGELVEDAARLTAPLEVPLRPQREFRRIGRPTPLHGARELLTGRARFTGDLRPEGLRWAVLARPPAPGARPLRFDRKAAEALPGVERVLELEEGLAVVAGSTWHALRGRQALAVEWSEGRAPGFSDAAFGQSLERALEAPRSRPGADFDPAAAEPGAFVVREGGVSGRAGGREVRAEYATSFQTHAPMEPPIAVARVEGRRCEVWAGTQFPLWAQHSLRERLGEGWQIVLHPQRMGGAFGRKEMPDFVLEAVAVARAMEGTPVQLFWSRDDDLRHGYYHPASRHRLTARLAEGGAVASWHHRIAAPALEAQQKFWRRGFELVPRAETNGAWNLPYEAPELAIEWTPVPIPIRLGYWRGIEIGNNVFAVESFVDELAHAAGRDPLEFRIAHLAHSSANAVDERFPLRRLRGVLELAAERAGWGTPLPAGRGRGLAGLVFDGHTACATVAEVALVRGAARVERVVCALDCGLVVNPLGLASNAEGAVAWGLSALGSAVGFEGGRPVASSFLDYPILRLPEMPVVEIHTVESDEPPTGTGEMPVPTIAPAVANAVFAAGGPRLRRLPFRLGELG